VNDDRSQNLGQSNGTKRFPQRLIEALSRTLRIRPSRLTNDRAQGVERESGLALKLGAVRQAAESTRHLMMEHRDRRLRRDEKRDDGDIRRA